MRILALDIGEKRCGIAVSDPRETVASPLMVLPTAEVVGGAPSFKRVLEDWEPELLLSGLPKSMSGSQGAQAKRIRAVAQDISASTGIPVVFTDERLSSSEAKRSLREKGLNEKQMRGKIDMIAAGLFLQAYLDSRRTPE